MVKAADHMKGRVMSLVSVNILLCMIGYEKEYQCMIDWGAGQCYVILQGEECLYTIG